ncbi:hypothetical protein DEV91_11534 [Phyllobacterium brassicacearum]|nr:hypothetical protein DEV91_11534 [Phyllobacterium brassicacearum]
MVGYVVWLAATWFSILAAAFAAFYWAKSSAVKTPHQSEGPIDMGSTATALRTQSKWSARGAVAAAIAAFLQGLATFIDIAGWNAL